MLTATEESQWFKWSQYWLFLLLRLHTWPVAALSALAALSKYCISIKCGNKEPFIVHMYKICSVQIVEKSCIIYSKFIWKQFRVDQLTNHNNTTRYSSLSFRLISNVNCVCSTHSCFDLDWCVGDWTNLNASLVPRVSLYSHKCCGELQSTAQWVNTPAQRLGSILQWWMSQMPD